MRRALRTLCLAMIAVGCFTPTQVEACTGIRLRTTDGSAIYARTLEFAPDMQSNILIIPRGKSFVGTLPDGHEGLRWTSKYGVVGANTAGLELIVDGVNERGLACGAFYHPGFASFPEVSDKNASQSIAAWQFMTWALTSCASVSEVIEALDQVELCNVVLPSMGFAPPMHFIVHDASGGCQVIEYIDGKRRLYDNPVGVMTNAPTFDWHMTNLHNYVGLSRLNAATVEIDGMQISPFGQGSGFFGLPGDFSSPSRFVRATAFSRFAKPVKTGDDGVNLAAHILNSFDIVIGDVEDRGSNALERTQWTTYADMTNGAYYFRTYDNQTIRKVDLKKINFNAPNCSTISMQDGDQFADVTSQAK